MTEYLSPVKIVKYENVDAPESLLIKQDLQISTAKALRAVCEKGGYVILDFGKELCAALRQKSILNDSKGLSHLAPNKRHEEINCQSLGGNASK